MHRYLHSARDWSVTSCSAETASNISHRGTFEVSNCAFWTPSLYCDSHWHTLCNAQIPVFFHDVWWSLSVCRIGYLCTALSPQAFQHTVHEDFALWSQTSLTRWNLSHDLLCGHRISNVQKPERGLCHVVSRELLVKLVQVEVMRDVQHRPDIYRKTGILHIVPGAVYGYFNK